MPCPNNLQMIYGYYFMKMLIVLSISLFWHYQWYKTFIKIN